MFKLQIHILVVFFVFFQFTLYSQDNSSDAQAFGGEEFEKNNPVFLQKGGMLRPGAHSFYIRTNDEWTGFSTVLAGYRFAPNGFFNFALEGGASPITHVYLAAVLLHFKLFESHNKIFFLGLRTRFGYKYMDLDFRASPWNGGLGENYLTVKRNGFYFAADLTAAFRIGPYRRYCIYYTIYPRFDFDLIDRDYPIFVMFSPIMVGYEVRFPKPGFHWSFAVEAGYTFPVPWNHIPEEYWVNFPSLANVSFNYHFGDKWYAKKFKK